MSNVHDCVGFALLRSQIGAQAAEAIATLDLGELLNGATGDRVDRTVIAAALNIVLFGDLLARVPSAAAYVAERRAAGDRICFDHGALRTIRFVDGPTGALPGGEAAFVRMTGRAYAHADAPEAMPQFFVSELHVEQFDPAFGRAARAIFGTSRDPLSATTKRALDRLEAGETLALEEAASVLAECVAAFDRQHDVPRLADYAVLLAQSSEAAWISTEGNAFNHATDRGFRLRPGAADCASRGAGAAAVHRRCRPDDRARGAGLFLRIHRP